MLGYKRSQRVGELIQQEISKIVMMLKEPGIGFVTITAVKLSDDLQNAIIFYSCIGTDVEVEKTKEIIIKSIPHIRYQLAQAMNLRKIPLLQFKYDDTPEKAGKVFEILEHLKEEEGQK
jgi:ribosome-binding factor A